MSHALNQQLDWCRVANVERCVDVTVAAILRKWLHPYSLHVKNINVCSVCLVWRTCLMFQMKSVFLLSFDSRIIVVTLPRLLCHRCTDALSVRDDICKNLSLERSLVCRRQKPLRSRSSPVWCKWILESCIKRPYLIEAKGRTD